MLRLITANAFFLEAWDFFLYKKVGVHHTSEIPLFLATDMLDLFAIYIVILISFIQCKTI